MDDFWICTAYVVLAVVLIWVILPVYLLGSGRSLRCSGTVDCSFEVGARTRRELSAVRSESPPSSPRGINRRRATRRRAQGGAPVNQPEPGPEEGPALLG